MPLLTRSLGNRVCKNRVRNRCPYRRWAHWGVDAEFPYRCFSLLESAPAGQVRPSLPLGFGGVGGQYFVSWMGAELCGENFLCFFLTFPLSGHTFLKRVHSYMRGSWHFGPRRLHIMGTCR